MATAAEVRAMRRALDAGRDAPACPPARTPASAACCSTRDGAVVAEGFHRGAGTPHAEVDALRRGGRAARGHRRRDARAVQPHRPYRALLRGAARGRRRARRATARRTPTRSRPAARDRLRAAGVDVEGGLLADEAGALNEAWTVRRHPRPPLRHLEARDHPRRPDRRRRRHEPLDHRRRRPAPTSTGCGPRSTPSLVGTGTGWPTTRPSPCATRDGRPAARAAAAAGRPRPPTVPAGGTRARRRRRAAGPRTHDLDEVARGPAGARRPARAARGRADPGRRVRRARGSSTGSSRTSRRRCSAPAGRAGRRGHHDDRRRVAAADRSTSRASGRTSGSRRASTARRRRTEMFTGIVEELGEVVAVERQTDARRLTVRGPLVVSDAVQGASIAVNGVCLTVVAHDGDDVHRRRHGARRCDRSSLGSLRRREPGQPRAPGHLWRPGSAAISCRGTSTAPDASPSVRRASTGRSSGSLPAALGRYVVEKGSITVDGVSLTVVEVGPDWFTVSLIPTTLERTTLGPQAGGRPGEPRGRRHRQVRREADARRPSVGRAHVTTAPVPPYPERPPYPGVRLDRVEDAVAAVAAVDPRDARRAYGGIAISWVIPTRE